MRRRWLGGLAMAAAVLGAVPALAQPLALVGVRAFPAPDAAPIDDAVVLMDGGRIVQVGARAATPIPARYQILSQPGGSVMAGFWNNHIHLTRPAFLKAEKASDAEVQAELQTDFTRWGFTTVVDLASTTEVANSLKARLAEGRVIGSRLLSVAEPFYPPGATPVYARPLYQAYSLPSAEIAGPADAAARVDRQIRAGADAVKLFTGSIQGGAEAVTYMSAEAVRAITTAAHRHSVLAFAHPTDRRGLEVAVENGVDVLAHAAPLMGPWSAEEARRIARRGVALVPTLSLFEAAANPKTPAAVAVQQARTLGEAGGVVLFGTDAGFTDDFDTTAEMRLMREALGWPGLLDSLTTAPARAFRDARRGRLAKGMTADLVVVDGDPAQDVGAMSRVRLVIRDGRVVYARP
jgi:imidazolonepropionase-like amidohydrolase